MSVRLNPFIDDEAEASDGCDEDEASHVTLNCDTCIIFIARLAQLS